MDWPFKVFCASYRELTYGVKTNTMGIDDTDGLAKKVRVVCAIAAVRFRVHPCRLRGRSELHRVVRSVCELITTSRRTMEFGTSQELVLLCVKQWLRSGQQSLQMCTAEIIIFSDKMLVVSGSAILS